MSAWSSLTSPIPIPVSIAAILATGVLLLKNKEDNANNAPISPWWILLLKAYIFGGYDDLYLKFQYDVKISATVRPNTSPPLIPNPHSPNNTKYVLII